MINRGAAKGEFVLMMDVNEKAHFPSPRRFECITERVTPPPKPFLPLYPGSNTARTDVGYNEVCLCCGERFRWANDFLRHVPNVSEMGNIMAFFMTTQRGMVVERIDRELFEAEGKNYKRQQENEDGGMLKKAKLTKICPATGNSINAPIHTL